MTDVIPKNGITKVPNDPYLCKHQSATGTQSPIGATLGLSICLNLTASFIEKSYQNAEGQIFVRRPKQPENTKKSNRGGQKGPRIQKGLTNRGKKVVRVLSDCYKLYHEGQCRFITTSCRQYIPDDPTMKTLHDNFLKRLRRIKAQREINGIKKILCPIEDEFDWLVENSDTDLLEDHIAELEAMTLQMNNLQSGDRFDYLWVAEIQTERLEKTGVRALHFHTLTPDIICEKEDCTFMDEAITINTAWNEVFANWALKDGRINEKEFNKWMDELRKNTNYNRRLEAFRSGKRDTEPRKPAKTKYLLTPNLEYVDNPGRYMSKYMSKGNESIVGGLYGASQKSREYLIPTEKVVDKIGVGEDPNITLTTLASEAKKAGIYTFLVETFNGDLVLWSRDISKVTELWKRKKSAIGTVAFERAEKSKPKVKYNPLIDRKLIQSNEQIALKKAQQLYGALPGINKIREQLKMVDHTMWD